MRNTKINNQFMENIKKNEKLFSKIVFYDMNDIKLLEQKLTYLTPCRWSINLFAFFPEILNNCHFNKIVKEDEEFFSRIFPDICEKPAIVVGNALVVHYSFGPQEENGWDSDREILKIYRKIAQVE